MDHREIVLRGFDPRAYEKMVFGKKSGVLTGRGESRAYFVEGEEVTAAQYGRRFPAKEGVPMMNGIASGCWPMRSKALAVHPRQVRQARERAKRHNINVAYEPDGTCVIPTQRERARLCRLEGTPDNNAGYSDYQGGDHKPPADDGAAEVADLVSGEHLKVVKE